MKAERRNFIDYLFFLLSKQSTQSQALIELDPGEWEKMLITRKSWIDQILLWPDSTCKTISDECDRVNV